MVEQAKKTTNDEVSEPQLKSSDPVRVWTFVILGIILLLLAWYLRADRVTPYTSQAKLHSLIIPIAPEVSGLVTSVAVKNNQIVDKGDVLFEIDVQNYRLAVQIAEAQFQAAEQAVAAAAAAVEAARASVDSAQANLVRAGQDAERLRKIRQQDAGAISLRRLESAEASFLQAQSSVAAAEANLQQALENYGSEGERNSRILQAQANLDKARRDLSLTTIRSPGRGLVTGVSIDTGNYASAGQPQMTYIAPHNFWVQADFTENNLAYIDAGDEVEMVFDVYPGKIIRGTVREMGFGVAIDDTPLGALPTIDNERDWLRDAQRFPVLIDCKLPEGEEREIIKIGSQAVAIIYTGENAFSNFLAKIYIRIISILTYAY